jgi:hypothetical protein
MEAMKKATVNKKTALRVVREPPEAGAPYVMDEVGSRIYIFNRAAHSRQQCRKTIVLSCHRCLINTGVEKMNNI